MTESLLLDEHYSNEIAEALRELGHDVTAVVALPELRGKCDDIVYEYAADNNRRVVTENIKDFRPLLTNRSPDSPIATLLFVSPRRFPRGGGDRQAVIIAAIRNWLEQPGERPQEDWLS